MPIFKIFVSWLREVAQVPWLHALHVLKERFREDRLGLTASSLTFTKVRITDRSAVLDNGVTATNGVVIVGSGSGPRIWLPHVSR